MGSKISFIAIFLSLAFLPTKSFASFIANCEFQAELTTLDPVVRTLGAVLHQRIVTAKILAAKNTGMSHINCEQRYLGQTISFPLQLLASRETGSAQKLGELRPNTIVRVKYYSMNGRALWGGVDATDYWLLP